LVTGINAASVRQTNQHLETATLEKAITYVFAGSPFRNAEVRGSIPLCSTNNRSTFQPLTSLTLEDPIFPSGQYVARNNQTQRIES